MPDLLNETTFNEAVQELHDQLGDVSLEDFAAAFAERYPDLMYRSTFGALKGQIRKALTAHDSGGLPRASSVDGLYKQRRFFSPDDYRVVITDYQRRHLEMAKIRDDLIAEAVRRYPEESFEVPA